MCYNIFMIAENIKMKGVYKFTLENIETGEKRIIVKDNLIPTAGRAFIASRLAQVGSPQDIKINYTALGTGTTAPSNGDTQLQTETYRKVVASATSSGAVAYFTAFYTAPEVTGTFKEAGMFINGTGTANTGTLFSRVAVDITKTNLETLTIDYSITIS